MTQKEEFTYKLVRSSRRTISLQVNADGSLLVRAPRRCSVAEINRFVLSKREWIGKQRKKLSDEQSAREQIVPLTAEELRRLADQALSDIPARVKYWSALVGVSYGRITIRNQRTRWGSCSNKGNLNFNCLLMLAPEKVRDYVVVHELCHRLHMNHSREFWNEVERVMPDYRPYKMWLRENGNRLMARNGV